MVKIFTEAGKTKGLGHYVRMETVYKRLIETSFDVEFYLDCDLETEKFLKQKGSNAIYEKWIDPNKLNDLVFSEDIVIVDSYNTDITLLEKINEISKKTIIIDDNVRLDYRDMIVLNPNYFGISLNYKQNDSIFLLGKDYTLLRKSFYPEKERDINEKVNRILITLGGTDVKRIVLKVIKTVKSINSDVAIDVVVTELYDDIAEIKENLGKKDKIYINATEKEMSDLMKKDDFAIATAGGTSNELIKVQCPAVLIAVAENQLLNIQYLESKGIVKRFHEFDMSPIKEMFDFSLRESLYKKEKELESGRNGIDAIIEIIKQQEESIC